MPADETECMKVVGDGHSVCLHCTIDLRPRRKPKPQRSVSRRAACRLPTLVRFLVLAHQIDEALTAGMTTSYAEVARQLGMTRARLTQIMNLLLLAPDIQERILLSDARTLSFLTERAIRSVLRAPDWSSQRDVFARLLGSTRQSDDATPS